MCLEKTVASYSYLQERLLQMGVTWKDIENEFKNQGPVSKAGFLRDVKKHVIDGGMFWYIGDVGRHLGGKNLVYSDYYAKIYHFNSNLHTQLAMETALEAAEYARQQGDMLQFWGFLYEAGAVDYAVSHVIQYCRVARKAPSPQWYWKNSFWSCDYYWTRYKRAKSEEERTYCLAIMSKVSLDAYRYVIYTYGESSDANVKKKLDKACFYMALSQLAEMNDTDAKEIGREVTQKKVLADVKGVCTNLKKLLDELEREEINTALLKQISPSRDIYNEFMSLRTDNKTATHRTQENIEYERKKRQEALLLEKQRLAEEQERQKKIKEQEKKRDKAKRRTFVVCVILILCVIKFVKIQVNANKDNWKIAYDNILNSSDFYAPQQYYKLHDMNYDGIPELISYHYTDSGSSYFDVCTYHEKGDTIAILYSEYNVIPYEIGNIVRVFSDYGDGVKRIYSFGMRDGQTDLWGKETDRNLKAVGLMVYEEGDILSGRYKDKEADLSYLEPPVDNEYWILDMETVYDMLINNYSTDDLYRRLRVKKYATSGSTNRAPKIVFDASILDYMGEMTYTSGMTLLFSWYADEYLEEEIFMETYDLEKLGDIGYGNGYICYSWNDEILVAVNRSRKFGTQVDIRLK